MSPSVVSSPVAIVPAATDRVAPDHAAIERLASRAGVRDVATSAGRVRWRCFGQPARADGRPPVALLHGGHGCWLHWVRNVEMLAERHTVWVADLPGFGDSDRPAGPE